MPLAVLMPVAITLYLVKNCLIVLTALFPIVNPLGTSPIFLRLTPGYTPEERHILSRKVAVNSYILLLASMLIGSHILTFFGISLPVVQVGGGLIVVANGWMLLQQREEPTQAQPNKKVTCDEITSSAFYPLTLPLTVGPGSISVAITLGANEGLHFDSLTRLFAAVIGIALVAITVYLSYRFAANLERLLGESAMNVIVRLSSFILVCIGVQIVWNGAKALLSSLPR
ncbi:MAG: MarC family protein [Bryobacteraceae bacterium]